MITKYFATYKDSDKDQLFCLILMMWSFGVDVLFLIFIYYDIWDTKEYQALAAWEDNIHTTAAVCCLINMGIKGAYIVFKCFGDFGKLCHGFKQMFCCCMIKD